MHSKPWEPLFLADWQHTVFLHFEVESEQLAPHVPFPLDLYHGDRAFVSLVAFTMSGMRPARGGAATAWLTRPIATHGFLNLRTYVRHRGEPGIYFLAEWLDNRIAAPLGPMLFGLPYRLGTLSYSNGSPDPVLRGCVRGARGRLAYTGHLADNALAQACASGGLDEFLVERYTAFTRHPLFLAYFRVWHPPWPLAQLKLDALDATLLQEAPGGPAWANTATFCGAQYSRGVRDVWMGRPHRIRNARTRTR